jgi:hypothetical protein
MLEKFRSMLKNPTAKQLKKSRIEQIHQDKIWDQLQRIEKANMKKFHTTLQCSAIFKYMEDRCFIAREGKFLLVFTDRVKRVFEKYKKNTIHAPYDMPDKELNFLAKLMLDCPEC